jgi:uncharacterized cupredoxin-like copper-binding protein
MRIFHAILTAVVMAPLASGIAFADAGHGHYKFGEPGQESEVTRTVEVIADDADGMELIMDVGTIQQGETIKFVITNRGAGDHEFSVGDTASQRAHAKLMAKNPDMKHDDDPSAVTLAPGETKTVIWTFNKPVQGNIVFACQMPGHYDAGMVHQTKLAKAKKSA